MVGASAHRARCNPQRGHSKSSRDGEGSGSNRSLSGGDFMSTIQESAPEAKPGPDERVARTSVLRWLLVRPEMGAIAGSIAVWIFFAIVASQGFLSLSGTATYLSVAAELGILSIAVALLMIGGEFDLSIGSMVGATGMIIAILSSPELFGWNIWTSIAIAVVFALGAGFLNGYLGLRTGLPSFIV